MTDNIRVLLRVKFTQAHIDQNTQKIRKFNQEALLNSMPTECLPAGGIIPYNLAFKMTLNVGHTLSNNPRAFGALGSKV